MRKEWGKPFPLREINFRDYATKNEIKVFLNRVRLIWERAAGAGAPASASTRGHSCGCLGGGAALSGTVSHRTAAGCQSQRSLEGNTDDHAERDVCRWPHHRPSLASTLLPGAAGLARSRPAGPSGRCVVGTLAGSPEPESEPVEGAATLLCRGKCFPDPAPLRTLAGVSAFLSLAAARCAARCSCRQVLVGPGGRSVGRCSSGCDGATPRFSLCRTFVLQSRGFQ